MRQNSTRTVPAGESVRCVVRSLVMVLAVASLGACKLRLEVTEGGYLTTESGRYECRPGVEALRAGSGARAVYAGEVRPHHGDGGDEGYHCDIEVADTDFDETFVAVPDAGYRFAGWAKGNRNLYGNSRKSTVRLTTGNFVQNDVLMGMLGNDKEIFRLAPVFELIGQTGDRDCSHFSGSFDRVQQLIFDNYDCTNSACHRGANSAGNLDLSAGSAYDNLFRVMASADLAEPMQRVYPGEQKFSFLYSKLEAATNGTPLPAGGGSPMPIAGPALSPAHLEALRLWIRGGAPETGDVDGVATLLGCSEPTPSQANKIDPPAPPPRGEGYQFVSGPWTVEANSENEVCFATYYDLEQEPGALPDWAKTQCAGSVFSSYTGECFATRASTLTQDPQSHHSIISVYVGGASALDPSWGEWQCLNGPHAGQACDPTRIGVPVAEGGADCGGERTVCGTAPRRTIACRGWGPSDLAYRQVSMGGAQSPIAAQVHAPGVYSILPARGVIAWNSHAFNLSDEATTVDQYNDFYFAAPDEREYRRRGIFDAKDIFVANVPPYEERTYCSTLTLPVGTRLTQLSSHAHKRGVLWRTWLPPQDPNCKVQSGCQPNNTGADYVSRVYNDPLYLDYDPPLALDSQDASERTLKFCVTYDNGKNHPDLLKRNSTSVGTTCYGAAYCAGGSNAGAFCGSDDSACGGGGVCDACVVTGGVTTEDEMFLMLGNYYVVPASERE